MTRDDVIRLAREAGIAPKPMTIDGVEYEYQHVEFNDNIGGDEFGCIERFTALMMEQCAKVCENLPMQQAIDVRDQAAAAIRARGEK